MRALHSSSALAVNFFDYWTDRDKTPIPSALGIYPDAGHELDFEAQFRTVLRRTPPHLDIAITLSTGFVVAIEGKFTEHLKRSLKGKPNFTKSYFPKSGGLRSRKDLSACQALAEELWAEQLSGSRQRPVVGIVATRPLPVIHVRRELLTRAHCGSIPGRAR